MRDIASVRKRKRGRPPIVDSNSGERLMKYDILLFPHQWSWITTQAASNRSEYLRRMLDEAMAVKP